MFNLSRKLSIKDQAAFAKKLAFLIKADVPIMESLRMIKNQSAFSRAKILAAHRRDI